MAGKWVQCPRCQVMVEVPEPEFRPGPAPAGEVFGARHEDAPDAARSPESSGIQAGPDERPEFEEEPRPGKKSRRRHPSGDRPHRFSTRGLDKVHFGLGFHYAAIIALLPAAVSLFLLGVVQGFFAFLIFFPGPHRPEVADDVVAWVVVASIILLAVSSIPAILFTIGSVFCLWVPARSKSRGFIIASLVLPLTAIPVSILLFRLTKGRASDFFGLSSANLMGFAAWVSFMLFLRSLAVYLGQGGLAQEASAILARGVVILVVVVVLPVMMMPFAGVLNLLGCFGLIPVGLVFCYGLYHVFILLYRELVLIGNLRESINERIR